MTSKNIMYTNDRPKTRTMRANALARLQEQENYDVTATPPQAGGVPTIRLTAATPSNAGSSFESNVSSPTFHVPQPHSIPETSSPLAPSSTTRKRLVPKKSKLGLLSLGGASKKASNADLSDVARRVGAPASTKGFEIYVDPANDPEIGEVVIVKKKKSRVALDGVFGDATNLPTAASVPADLPKKKSSLGPMSLLKRSTGAASMLKSEDEKEQKWWTISRGRKDSKPKTKDAKTTASPGRFNSLDSGILLNSPITSDLPAELEELAARSADAATLSFAPAPKIVKTPVSPPPSMGRSISFTPASLSKSSAPKMMRANSDAQPALLAPPGEEKLDASNPGSIAVRAMRSMRSLAQISSWANLKGDDKEAKEKEPKETKKEKKVKARKEKAVKEKGSTLRLSNSSFEAGALTPAVSPAVKAGSERKSSLGLGERKKSLLGLGMGWPSTMRSASSPVAEALSPAASIRIVKPPAQEAPVVARVPPSAFTAATQRISIDAAKRLSADSTLSEPDINLASTVGRARAGSRSTMSSTNSSLRPLSTSSGTSCGSSIVSVRWDEEGLATVKENRERERRTRRMESRRGSEERRRTSLASVFPETKEKIRSASGSSSGTKVEEEEVQVAPKVTIETATLDGHEQHELSDDEEVEEESLPRATPAKLPRPRPMSEQLLGKSRPRGMTDDSEGVLSILDAATNELANLIGRLDLEATPATPDMSPLKPSSSFLGSMPGSADSTTTESPTKSQKRGLESPSKRPTFPRGLSASSITSLRPYAQSRGATKTTTTTPASPVSSALPTAPASFLNGRPVLGQQIAPWGVLNKNISPGKPRVPSAVKPLLRPSHMRTMTPHELPEEVVIQPLQPPARTNSRVFIASPQRGTPVGQPVQVPHGSSTFGRRSGKKALVVEEDNVMASPSPVFRPPPGHHRKRSSLVPIEAATVKGTKEKSKPSAQDVFGSTESSLIVNPKRVSDLPDDLHDFLDAHGLPSRVEDESGNESTSSSDTPSSPGAPPVEPLPMPTLAVPVFRLIDDEQRLSDIDLTSPTETSDEDTKKSFEFTEELKRLNESGVGNRRSFVEQLENAFQTPSKLDLNYGFGAFLAVDAPPVPAIPARFVDEQRLSVATVLSEQDSIMDTTEETEESQSELLSSNNVDSLGMSQDISSIEVGRAPQPECSQGELNMHFKFGGRPSPSADMPSSVGHSTAPITLSDIIPTAEHVRRHSIAESLDNCTYDISLVETGLCG